MSADLLFQAPTFQAPTFQEPSVRFDESEASTKSTRRSRSVSDKAGEANTKTESASTEETAGKSVRGRGRRTKKTAAVENDSAAETMPSSQELSTPGEEEPRTKRRRRRANSEVAAEAGEETASASFEENAEAETQDNVEGSEETEGTSRRRRRRRTRAGNDEESGDFDDQIHSVKGSTRLEAKKQRRREGRKENRRRHSITESEFLARRESVKRSMVIRHQDGLDQIAVLEDDLLVEHYVARRTQTSMVGNIYLGRVQNVLPSMEAAFVDIGRGRNGVLYAGEVNWDAAGLDGKPRRIEMAMSSGDPVLVQVTKDPIGHKGARLTSQITLAGRYLVLIPGGSMMGISRKLPDKERSRLKRILKKVVPDDAGVIVRTAAEGATEEQISDDVTRLTKQWADIEKKKTNTKAAPLLLRGEPELAVRVVRDIFNEDFQSLTIQGKETYDTVREYVEELSPELAERVEYWAKKDDIFAQYRIDEQLSKGMDRKVWLPSGGSLIIDRTEAMTVIDVNTGKFIGAGGTLEETVTRNNLEAAEEIVRQLRLRDIGGIVIIDFVDMVLEQNRDLVLRRLVECLGRDRTRHQVTEITSLGLVQMTRKRVGEGLVEAFSTTCEHCEGKGFVVHQHPVETAVPGEPTPKSAKKRKAKQAAEARRVDEGPDREKAREALTAIAAASHVKEDAEATATDEAPETAASGTEMLVAEEGLELAETGKNREKETVTSSKRGSSRGRKRTSVPQASADSVAKEKDEVEAPRAAKSSEKTEDAVRPARKRRRAVSAGEAEPTTTTIPVEVTGTQGAADSSQQGAQSVGRRKAVTLDEILLPDRSGSATATAVSTRRRRRAVSVDVQTPGE